jgi:hypothetical protein
MGLMDLFRGRSGGRLFSLVGRIAEDPEIVLDGGIKYMHFHLVEAPGTTFRLKLLPTTPKRRKGDRVELTYRLTSDGLAEVETLSGAKEGRRRRGHSFSRDEAAMVN